MFNAIASGEAVVENFQRAADCISTLRCLRLLGASWEWRDETTLRVQGSGRYGLREPHRVLDCGNSGTTIRLLTGLLAPQPFLSVLSGDASLRSRPFLGRVIEPLRRMGGDLHARDGDRRAPMAISGRPLRGISYRVPSASAQVKSALLLAGLYAEGEMVVEEPVATRDHTERMLRAMGATVHSENNRITVEPLPGDLQPLSMRVPGDISSAASWLVLGAVHADAEVRVAGVSVNPTRTGILDVLDLMGADIAIEEERNWGSEPVADVVVRSSPLRGAQIGGELVPRAIDELPLVALAACFAEGETVIRDAHELRVKETDRIRTTVAALRRLGADIEELPDGMRITGRRRLRGASLSSHGDHRLAMMLAVAGAVAEGAVVIGNAGAVAVSYPCFWRDLDALTSTGISRA